jgi:hypothetical protein
MRAMPSRACVSTQRPTSSIAMKAHEIVTVAVMLTLTVQAQDTQKQASVSKADLQRLYTAYLKDEGYNAELDPEGDVKFKREGRTYFIPVSEDDPEYFRIILPRILDVESEEQRAKILAAANDTNGKTKVAKVIMGPKSVYLTLELFVARPEDFKPIFHRAMSAVDFGRSTFIAKLREKSSE